MNAHSLVSQQPPALGDPLSPQHQLHQELAGRAGQWAMLCQLHAWEVITFPPTLEDVKPDCIGMCVNACDLVGLPAFAVPKEFSAILLFK